MTLQREMVGGPLAHSFHRGATLASSSLDLLKSERSSGGTQAMGQHDHPPDTLRARSQEARRDATAFVASRKNVFLFIKTMAQLK